MAVELKQYDEQKRRRLEREFVPLCEYVKQGAKKKGISLADIPIVWNGVREREDNRH